MLGAPCDHRPGDYRYSKRAVTQFCRCTNDIGKTPDTAGEGSRHRHDAGMVYAGSSESCRRLVGHRRHPRTCSDESRQRSDSLLEADARLRTLPGQDVLWCRHQRLRRRQRSRGVKRSFFGLAALALVGVPSANAFAQDYEIPIENGKVMDPETGHGAVANMLSATAESLSLC